MDIPFLRPHLVGRDAIDARLRAMEGSRRYSNFGPLVSEFERRVVSQLLGARGSALTVCNATIGLMLAIAALRRPKARYALMPSFTFAATPLAAQWCGLEPWFIDVRPDDWCMDEEALAGVLKTVGDDVAVVVAYAAFGAPIDLAYYTRLHMSGMPVVVDAAPCLGARNESGPFAADFPGAVVYSLHATKAFAIGEGGLIYSGGQDLIARLRRMSNFGFDDSRSSIELGLNAKLPEISAAVALATLEVFDEKIQVRESLFECYRQLLNNAGLLAAGCRLQKLQGSVPHQFVPIVGPQTLGNAELVSRLAQQSIEARTYFSPPCHRQPQFGQCPRDQMSVTDELAARVLSLPLWEEMSEDQVRRVVMALADGVGATS